MSRFINILQETLSVINEQDPAMDPAMMAPAPPGGPIAQADRESIEEPEPVDIEEDAKELIDLARRLFILGLNSDRTEINDVSFAKIAQKVTNSNAKAIRAVMERLVRDNQIETGL